MTHEFASWTSKANDNILTVYLVMLPFKINNLVHLFRGGLRSPSLVYTHARKESRLAGGRFAAHLRDVASRLVNTGSQEEKLFYMACTGMQLQSFITSLVHLNP